MIALALALAQTSFEGTEILARLEAKARAGQWQNLPIGERMSRLGLELIGTPYVGWTLERDVEREFCFVTLQGLDCVTFFENVLAMARALPKGPLTPQAVLNEVTRTRYRGGKVDGYLSRLHYTGDWMRDNVAKGTVAWVGPGLSGAQPWQKEFSFMSRNAKVYRQLEANPSLIEPLRAQEASLSKFTFTYFPKAAFPAAEAHLRSGDIIGLTATTPGMDCSHTGLIVQMRGRARFLHASSAGKRVMLDGTMTDYLSRNEKNTGVFVVRPL